MIVLSGYLGANECYFQSLELELAAQFDYGKQSSFSLMKGSISSVEAAALLALHSFCYSDRFDYERLSQESENYTEISHG